MKWNKCDMCDCPKPINSMIKDYISYTEQKPKKTKEDKVNFNSNLYSNNNNNNNNNAPWNPPSNPVHINWANGNNNDNNNNQRFLCLLPF